MSKQKWKAWFVTTLVLFTIVRLVETCRAQRSDSIQSDIDDSITEEPPTETPGKSPKEIQLKGGLVKKELTKEEPAKLIVKKKTLSNVDKFKVFKEPTNKVYFKVIDKLALVGGDIIIGQIKDSKEKDLSNNVFEKKIDDSKLWPSPDIPYGFSENISDTMKSKINGAIDYLNQNTSINLHPIDPDYDEDAIVFETRLKAPCASYVGKIGGLQPIFVNPAKCGQQEVLHEILHSLGFVHEQQRESRVDNFKILWENIKPGQEHNFALLPDSLIHPYSGSVFNIDLESIMMYPDEAFSKKTGLKTIKSLTGLKINPVKTGLSSRDKDRVNYLYGN